MITFKVRNYRGLSAADIELSILTLIAGKNAAGKTSLIDAIRSVATAEYNPFGKEITKKEISMLVRSGTPSGFAEIVDGEDIMRVDWPKCDYATTGKAVTVSPVAAGILSLVDMNSTDRINYIVKMMSASPTGSDLIKELRTIDIFEPEETDDEIKETDFYKALWTGIEDNGWDIMYAKAKDKGAERKAKWEIVSGVNDFGIRKAEVYEPDAWSPAMLKLTEEVLIADVNKAKEWAEAATKDVAISDHEKSRLGVLSQNIEGITKKMDALKVKQDIVESTMNKKKSRIRVLSSTQEVRGLICPKCKATLTLTENVLKTIPEKEVLVAGKNAAEIKQLDNDIKCLEEQNKQLISDWGSEKAALTNAKDAAVKLINIDIKETPDIDAKVEDVQNKLVRAEERLAAFRQYHESLAIFNQIRLNKKLQDILAPSGLRNKKLTTALKVINNSMKMLTDSVDWNPVELNADCGVEVNGVKYGRLLAKSERYRARVLLQLMVAMSEKSAFTIIDDADELVKGTRNDLMSVILDSKIKSIVVTALNERDEMPDLAHINGLSYWIENGSVA